MSVQTCDICSHKLVCMIRKKVTEFLMEEYLHFGEDHLPIEAGWFEFVGSKCRVFTEA